MKHKHCDLIKAWADGAQIQCKDITNYSNPKDCKWKDFNIFDYEIWDNNWEYRIKPQIIKYRLYLYKRYYLDINNGINIAITFDNSVENWEIFIKWISDWQEYEVPSDS